MNRAGNLEELKSLVRAIPRGKCVSYGALGRALPHPASGRLVGRWMAQCADDVPWWRVVAKSGELPIRRRDPRLELLQRARLEEENVPFDGERVDMERCWWDPADAEPEIAQGLPNPIHSPSA